MRRPDNHIFLTLAVGITLVLTGYQVASAQQEREVAVKIDTSECVNTAHEVSYKTLTTFVPWLLARAERIAVIGEVERQAIFSAFAKRQLWRTGIPAGYEIEG